MRYVFDTIGAFQDYQQFAHVHITTLLNMHYLASLRHNELRDLTAELLTEICKDVSKEPALSNLTDTEEELRADVSARGLWQPMQRAFIDVRVFHPFAPSYRNQSVSATFKSMENEKKRKYNRRIIERENGTFTPLIFTSNGGMSRETSIFFSRIAEMICEKRNCTKGEVSICSA